LKKIRAVENSQKNGFRVRENPGWKHYSQILWWRQLLDDTKMFAFSRARKRMFFSSNYVMFQGITRA